jgi:hypothetical protein
MVRGMSPLSAAFFGLLGGVAVEGFDFASTMKRHGDWPWRTWRLSRHRRRGESEPNKAALFVTYLLCRVGASVAVAYGLAAGDQIQGVFAAFGVGAAGGLALQKYGLGADDDSGPEDSPDGKSKTRVVKQQSSPLPPASKNGSRNGELTAKTETAGQASDES